MTSSADGWPPLGLSDRLAIVAGKLSARAIRALGAGLGSNLPGRLARKVSPEVLRRLSAQCRLGVIAVSGTNGKSTTAGFIYSILRRAGLKIVHNRQGANLVTGITASIVEAATYDGRLDADYCLFEIDEASLPVVAAEVVLGPVVVTNLFRDQLDRFGELDTTASLIGRGLLAHRSPAILNADDPNVAQLAEGCPRLYYGIESLSGQSTPASGAGAMELSCCPRCNSDYEYSLVFYGQLGHYRCRSCRHGRPEPRVAAENVVVQAGSSSFLLRIDGERLKTAITLPGLFNVYNALAAAALASFLGIPALTVIEGLENYSTLFGRSERLSVGDKTVLIQLIKNPAGATQVVSSAAADPAGRLLIAINDNLADGRDVSWLWDAEFELLSGHKKVIVVSGQRAHDMAVRLKYAGVEPALIEVVPSLEKAVGRMLERVSAGETLWILPTYTCLLELQKILKARGYLLAGT